MVFTTREVERVRSHEAQRSIKSLSPVGFHFDQVLTPHRGNLRACRRMQVDRYVIANKTSTVSIQCFAYCETVGWSAGQSESRQMVVKWLFRGKH